MNVKELALAHNIPVFHKSHCCRRKRKLLLEHQLIAIQRIAYELLLFNVNHANSIKFFIYEKGRRYYIFTRPVAHSSHCTYIFTLLIESKNGFGDKCIQEIKNTTIFFRLRNGTYQTVIICFQFYKRYRKHIRWND